jgi:hypothetical protein
MRERDLVGWNAEGGHYVRVNVVDDILVDDDEEENEKSVQGNHESNDGEDERREDGRGDKGMLLVKGGGYPEPG